MGNRAVISFSDNDNATGIYLHWNGGPESVTAFIEAAKQMGARSPQYDESYAMAGLIRAITLFMHNNGNDTELLSVGVGPVNELDTDNGDNGWFIVGPDWSVTRGRQVIDTTPNSGIKDSILEAHNILQQWARDSKAA